MATALALGRTIDGAPRPEGHTSGPRRRSGRWLPTPRTTFRSSSTSSYRPGPERRVHAAIAAFGRVTGRDQLDGFYKNILKRMATSLQGVQQNQGDKGAKDAAAEQQGMLMDIAAALVPGLKPEALEKLLGIVNVSVVYKDPGIQKKSYKLLRAILSRSADLKSRSLEGVRESLSNAQSFATPPQRSTGCFASGPWSPSWTRPALTWRTRTSRTPDLAGDGDRDVHKKNSKTHRAALDLLAETAHGFKGPRSAMGSPLMEPGPLGFINVVAGGSSRSTRIW